MKLTNKKDCLKKKISHKFFHEKTIFLMAIVGARGPRKGTTSYGCHYRGIVNPKRESSRG